MWPCHYPVELLRMPKTHRTLLLSTIYPNVLRYTYGQFALYIMRAVTRFNISWATDKKVLTHIGTSNFLRVQFYVEFGTKSFYSTC